MDNTPRKASDIILSLEQKIDHLLKINSALDFDVKVLSNKLNTVIEAIDAINSGGSVPPLQDTSFVEAPSFIPQPPLNSIPIVKEHALQVSEAPNGPRRTARPDAYTATQGTPTVNMPPTPKQAQVTSEVSPDTSKVAVQQRVVNKSGGAIFLADVEIKNASNGQVIHKCRTNGVGKWVAPLPVGTYQVTIKKKETATREQLETVQNLIIDGSKSPLDLQIVIMK